MAESIISNVLNKAIDGAYNFVNVLPWGNYATVGQTANLVRDITKAKFIRVWSGWSNSDAGIHFDYFDHVVIGNVYVALYLVGGKLEYVAFQWPTATTIEIMKSSNTDLGIRMIDAVF